jgi:hypothetical protein
MLDSLQHGRGLGRPEYVLGGLHTLQMQVP